MNKLLVIENLTKIYSSGTPLEVRALKSINLEIEKGVFVYVLGPSGSGKTTLLNMAGLLDYPTAGKIYFKGDDVSLISEKKRAVIRNRSIGFIFQQPSFLPEFTALENVLMPALIGASDCKAARGRAEEFFEGVGMSARRNHFPSQLSGGELQRLTILRALINEPEIILCDEPTGQLDEDNAALVLKTLREVARDGSSSVVFVTHNQALTKDAETVINLRDGRIEN